MSKPANILQVTMRVNSFYLNCLVAEIVIAESTHYNLQSKCCFVSRSRKSIMTATVSADLFLVLGERVKGIYGGFIF